MRVNRKKHKRQAYEQVFWKNEMHADRPFCFSKHCEHFCFSKHRKHFLLFKTPQAFFAFQNA
jgi:hypothetical protein